MTIEQAINELYSIRDFWLLPRHGDNGRGFEVREAVDMAVTALRAQQGAEKNEPLTMEHLRQMDGQPVWAEEPDGYKHYSRWVLVDCPWKSKGLVYLCSYPGAITFETFSVNGGKIYRRPPVKERAP